MKRDKKFLIYCIIAAAVFAVDIAYIVYTGVKSSAVYQGTDFFTGVIWDFTLAVIILNAVLLAVTLGYLIARIVLNLFRKKRLERLS